MSIVSWATFLLKYMRLISSVWVYFRYVPMLANAPAGVSVWEKGKIVMEIYIYIYTIYIYIYIVSKLALFVATREMIKSVRLNFGSTHRGLDDTCRVNLLAILLSYTSNTKLPHPTEKEMVTMIEVFVEVEKKWLVGWYYCYFLLLLLLLLLEEKVKAEKDPIMTSWNKT